MTLTYCFQAKKIYDKIDKEAETAKANFEKIERSESANRKKVYIFYDLIALVIHLSTFVNNF